MNDICTCGMTAEQKVQKSLPFIRERIEAGDSLALAKGKTMKLLRINPQESKHYMLNDEFLKIREDYLYRSKKATW